MVVFARINVKESELIGSEENRKKLFLETEMLWQPREELAERTLHGVSVAGSIAGVANRTKNAVRVMCSRVSTLLYERDRIIPVLKNRSPNMHSSTSLVSGQRLCVPSSTILMCFSYASVICNSVGRSSKQDKRNIVSI